MKKSTITIRVDDKLKAQAEEACDYLGETLTSIINKQLRSTIDEYYKRRAYHTQKAREIQEGDLADLMFKAAKREAVALQMAGFDSLLDAQNSPEALRYSGFYNFLFNEVCNELGIPYESMPQRIREYNNG